jgi:ribonuclease-3
MNSEFPENRLLEKILGYHFDHDELLNESLRHSSFVNEQADPSLQDNERLEFLGDAVLNLVIGHLLMRDYPQMREGDMSRIRATMVNETQLAQLARTIELGRFLRLGKGELLTNGQEKNSLLANAFEALTAAVYLDKGFTAVFAFIENHFQDLLQDAHQLSLDQDFKSRLQEAIQSNCKNIPTYEVVQEIGPDHDKTFHVAVRVGEMEAQGQGKSKKTAEQDAARNALERLQRGDGKPCP